MTMTFHRDKFRELILYFAERSEDDPFFGAVKLNKQLFFTDFLAYAEFGSPVTGATYKRLPQGPVPHQLLPVQNELVQHGEAEVVDRNHFGYKQKRTIARRPADLDLLDERERTHIEEVFELVRPFSATDVSNFSHTWLAWELAEPGQTIPYSAAFLSARPPTEEEFERGRELAAQHGW